MMSMGRRVVLDQLVEFLVLLDNECPWMKVYMGLRVCYSTKTMNLPGSTAIISKYPDYSVVPAANIAVRLTKYLHVMLSYLL